jgi:hypothetical protein
MLTRLFIKKPRYVIRLLRKQQSSPGSASQTSLIAIRSPTGNLLITTPADVTHRIETLASDSLLAVHRHPHSRTLDYTRFIASWYGYRFSLYHFGCYGLNRLNA